LMMIELMVLLMVVMLLMVVVVMMMRAISFLLLQMLLLLLLLLMLLFFGWLRVVASYFSQVFDRAGSLAMIRGSNQKKSVPELIDLDHNLKSSYKIGFMRLSQGSQSRGSRAACGLPDVS
jgi:hypothetical protein